MNNLNFKVPSKLMAVYCLWIDEERVYIGKTKNLKTRLIYHQNDCGIYKDRKGSGAEWKHRITKVSYFKCTNLTDLDILETYLINYYNTRCNKAKKYGGVGTFNIPIPEELYLNTRIPGSFSQWAESVFKNEKELLNIPDRYIILKEAHKLLDAETVKSLKYKESAIRSRVKYEQVKSELYKNLKLNEFYTNAEIKKELKLACQLHNIKREYKTTRNIIYFYSCEYTHKKINNVVKEGYLLLGYK